MNAMEIERRRLAFKNLVLDLDARQVIFWGRNIEVTRLEFQLLQYLIQNAGVVISKDDLLQNVWGYDRSIEDTNLIEAAIRRLRKKLETDPSRVWRSFYLVFAFYWNKFRNSQVFITSLRLIQK